MSLELDAEHAGGNAAISVCEKGWPDSDVGTVSLELHAGHAGVDEISHNAAISVCGNDWPGEPGEFDEITRFLTAISACEKGDGASAFVHDHDSSAHAAFSTRCRTWHPEDPTRFGSETDGASSIYFSIGL